MHGVKYDAQPEFGIRVRDMNELRDKGMTVLGGPFVEKPGGLNGPCVVAVGAEPKYDPSVDGLHVIGAEHVLPVSLGQTG